jgi:cytochrome bd ubiquinol oxidase subunit II
MLTLVIIILGISFILYTLLGGADFGAGIIETFAGKRGEQTISKAMAPVWEANHVWLILAVVILFTAFPAVYSSLSLVLHIPLMMVLIGIIFRGTAFTFRHYDVVHDSSHKYYTFLFKLSSFITPVFLGAVLGAMILGRITLDPSAGFYEKFVLPWFNIFCLAMGIFSASLFAYIAAVFLVGEARIDSERKKYSTLSKRSMLLTLLTGMLVILAGELEGNPLVSEFLHSTTSVVMLLFAGLLCPVIWVFLNRKKDKTLYLRAAIGLQVSAILIGWFYIQYPVLIQVKGGDHLTIFNTQAPSATLQQLLIALSVGLVLIIPAFIYLFRVFKVKTN